MEIALSRGKANYDKRQSLKSRDAERENGQGTQIVRLFLQPAFG